MQIIAVAQLRKEPLHGKAAYIKAFAKFYTKMKPITEIFVRLKAGKSVFNEWNIIRVFKSPGQQVF